MSSESDDSCDTKVEKWRSADVKTVENVEFRSLLLSDPIMQGLKSCGFEKPSPVQLQAIPLGRCGLDLVVQAKSGTGKTGVLAVVALDSLIVDSPCTQVLILAPTREIAAQVCGVVTSLGCAFRGLTCETFIGGLPLREDKAKLPNCQIVVGTPGRIKQLIDMEHLRTDSIRLFIVDEADRLFDKQFKEDINWIFSSLPARKQILALSATYPEELSKFLALYMENPVYVRINSKDPSLLGITQYFRSTPFHPMLQVTDAAKFDILLDILKYVSHSQCMIFCQRQTKAQDLADNLVLKGFAALSICGALDQGRRLEIIDELKKFRCRVLVSTDLTARGIDAENVDLVINFDVPYEGEIYLHRIGRAGRYGTRGMSISLACTGDEIKRLKSFQKKFLFKIYQLPDPIPDDLWDMSVALAASLPEEQQDRHVSAETNVTTSSNDISDHTVPKNPVAEKQLVQPVEVNHSVSPNSLEKNVLEISCGGNSAESNHATLPNGSHEMDRLPSPVLEVKVALNNKDELINSEDKTEKMHNGEDVTLDNSATEGKVEPEKRNEQLASHVENKDELKIASDDAVQNAFVANPVVQIKEQMMGITHEINTSDDSNSRLIFSTTSLTSDLLDVGLDATKAEGFDESKNQGEKNLSKEHSVIDPVKCGNTKNTEYNCDSKIPANSEEKPQDFQIKSLFLNWEKYMQSGETSDFPDKEISNILLPLLSSNKTKYRKSDLSYDKLVECLEPYNEDSANDPIEHHLESYFPSSSSITGAQLTALQKYILRDRSAVLSRVQKKFDELQANLVPCKADEAINKPRSSVDDENLDVLLQSSSVSQSGAVVELDRAENELGNNVCASDSLVLPTEDKSCSEIKPTSPESVKTNILKEPDTISHGTVAAKPLSKTDCSPKERRSPVSEDKSVGFMKAGGAVPKNNARLSRKAHNLTEADYDSVSLGLKHYVVVPLPPGPCDAPKNDSLQSARGSDYAHSSNRERKVKDQSAREKTENERRTSQRAEKPKLKGNFVHSTKHVTYEPAFSDKSRGMARENASLPSADRETQYRSRKSVYGQASMSHCGEQNSEYKKKHKVKSTGHKNMRNFPNHPGNKTNVDSVDQNPVDFTNGVNDRIGHSDFWEASYTPSYPQNGFSGATGAKPASGPPPSHGIYSCGNMPPGNRCALQYGCCCRPRPQYSCWSRPLYDCCCRPSYVLPNGCYSRSLVPFQNTYPQCYYYKKYLEQWYYIQELTRGYHHH